MPGLFTLDFETYYDKEYSLRKMTTEEYIRDSRFEPLIVSIRHPDGSMHTHDLYDLTDAHIHDLFHDIGLHEGALLAQNTMFDAAILNWRYGVKPKLYLDTMLMGRVVCRHATGSVNLKTMADHFGIGSKGEEVQDAMAKHREHFTDEEWQAYREYCENDVALTYLLFELMSPLVPQREFKIMSSTLRWYVEPSLRLDMDFIDATVSSAQIKTAQHLKASGLDSKQLSSNKQFSEWLESMGVPCPMKPSPSNPAKQIPALAKSDAQFIQMKDHHPNETIRIACEARLNAKSRITETRMERFQGIGRRNDCLLPVPLLYSGAHTHRYAGDEAINMQNLPVDIRQAIRAPEGHVLVSADQGQIEARLNACLSGQDDLIEDFRLGRDVYRKMAAAIYNIPLSEVTDYQRKVGKAVVLGCGYGMGSDRFFDFANGQWQLGLEKSFCQFVIDTYRTEMGYIKQNWRRVNDLLHVVATGGEQQYGPVVFKQYAVELPGGLHLHFPNMSWDGDNYRYQRYDRRTRKWNWVKIYGAMMVENLCQALARELLTDQMEILEKKWNTVHQVHDELWFIVPEGEADLACQVMKKVMEIPPQWMPELPLSVEPSAAVQAHLLK